MKMMIKKTKNIFMKSTYFAIISNGQYQGTRGPAGCDCDCSRNNFAIPGGTLLRISTAFLS